MPNKCAAVGCKSGCSPEDNADIKATFHSFPLKNEYLLKQWLRRLPRKDFTPSKHSVLCSLHFVNSDFITSSTDSNFDRKRKRSTSLQNRYLKRDAIPSVWPNLPSYLSTPAVAPRSEKATSSNCLQNEALILQKQIDSFFSEDRIASYDELISRFQNETKPEGFLFFEADNGFNLIIVSTELPYRVILSITVSKLLDVTVYFENQNVPPSSYDHIISPHSPLSKMSQLLNLMAIAKSLQHADHSVVSKKQVAIDALNSYLSETEMDDFDDDDEIPKIIFLKEQLELGECSKYSRRYSPEMLVFAYILHATSSSAYET